LANSGFIKAIKKDPALAKGVNVYEGFITFEAVAKAHGLKHKSLKELI